MAMKENEIRALALADKMAKTELHNAICKCSICMRGDKIDSSERATHMEGLKSTMVDRKNPDNPGPALMKATEAHAIIQAGTKVDMREKTGIHSAPKTDNVPQLKTLPELGFWPATVVIFGEANLSQYRIKLAL